MEQNRLLGDKGEPASEDGQPFRPLPCHRTSRPGFRETLVFGAMLLILSAAGNLFQYWHYHQVATDCDRSKIGKSKIRPQFSWKSTDLDTNSWCYSWGHAAIRDKH